MHIICSQTGVSTDQRHLVKRLGNLIDMSGGEGGTTVLETPPYVIALVFFFFLVITLGFEKVGIEMHELNSGSILFFHADHRTDHYAAKQTTI